MSSIYKPIFEEIFNSSAPYIVNDFSKIKGQNGNSIQNFVSSTLVMIFDATIKSLEKARYNGLLVLQDNFVLDKYTKISSLEVINKSKSLLKKRINVENNGIRLSNAREEATPSRITMLFDGISAFSNGVAGFSVVLCLQEADNNSEFKTQFVMSYDPITKETCSFDGNDGFRFNDIKIATDEITQEKIINSVIVNDYSSPFHFNINKMVEASNACVVNNSFFNAFNLLMTTKINLLICLKPKGAEMFDLVEFCCKVSGLEIKEINGYLMIGKKTFLDKIYQE